VDVRCDHVALLVAALEPAIEALCELDGAGLVPGPIETFVAEGTREVYLDRGRPGPARLLLMQSIGPGPYARALARRGPGLHHVALDVADARAYALGREGWLLHPRSLETWPKGKTIWLARPGVGALIEVQERPVASDTDDATVYRIEVPADDARRVEALGCEALCASADEGAWLVLAGARVLARLF
jgi:hypothetical protein